MSLPELPYAGTSGWSGSMASKDRALEEDARGATAHRQAVTLAYLAEIGPIGATWKDLAKATGWHHGQASSVLSVLHKTGHVARLANRRERASVYCLPEDVHGRETRTYNENKPKTCPNCGCGL